MLSLQHIKFMFLSGSSELRYHQTQTPRLDHVADGMCELTRKIVAFHLRQSFIKYQQRVENGDQVSLSLHSRSALRKRCVVVGGPFLGQEPGQPGRYYSSSSTRFHSHAKGIVDFRVSPRLRGTLSRQGRLESHARVEHHAADRQLPNWPKWLCVSDTATALRKDTEH